MELNEQIDRALIAHGAWKQRLFQAIQTGKSEFNPTIVQTDNRCEFGAWLYSQSGEVRQSPQWNKVRQLHADFHREAARVLTLALQGRRKEAEAAVAAGSVFHQLTGQLTVALGQWKQARAA